MSHILYLYNAISNYATSLTFGLIVGSDFKLYTL